MKQAGLALFVCLLACGVAFAQSQSPKKAPARRTGAKAARPDLLKPATMTAPAPDNYRVKFTTTKGDVLIDVTRAWAPRGADRFYNLVRAGFYTDAAFFRVIPDFMAQFGISARPEVSQIWTDEKIADDPVRQSNTRGRITFATAGTNTRTTQLFINYGDNSRLDELGFAPFGEVVEGMEVVDQVNAEYREQPDQSSIRAEGKSYLDANFPRLDRILSAAIVPRTAPVQPAPDGQK
ncbi:MAG TPA: peptidylprolyl isomerase [Bryobacteraceae bacterium]|nr:peptidylprolyl isomerase [Bryobacteraceae bacterium]